MANLHYLRVLLSLLPLVLTLSPLSQQHQEDPIRIIPYIIDYRNGTILRDTTSSPAPFVPPPNTSAVRSKDITLPSSSTHRPLRARVFLPRRPDPNRKIPVLVYYHGGAFCIGSPFAKYDTIYLARVAAEAHVIALSVDYTLFPDGVVPTPYDDSWAFLRWVAAHKSNPRLPGSDPWLARFGDLDRVFVGGDSAGGNIAHNMAVRAGMTPLPGSVKLTGAFLAMPYFLGSRRVGSEPGSITESPNYKVWAYVCPNCKAGVDDPVINPGGPGAPSLRGLGCERMLVYVAEVDELLGRDVWYYVRVKESGWSGRVELIEAKGKSHVFHILEPHDPSTTKLIQDLA